MKTLSEHDKKLKRLYSLEDGRLQGKTGWEKLPFFWFLLFLSYRCTRRCNYCYAFNQVGYDNSMEMDENTFSRLVEWIPEVWRANNVKINVIVFLGGEPLLRTDRIKTVMESVYRNTDGMQGDICTNGDLVDSVKWEDLEYIQWMTTNITDIGIDELARRMKIIGERSNVIGQTIAATLDEYNLGRVQEITRFGMENNYRLRYSRNIFNGLDAAYKKRLLKRYHEVCDALEEYVIRGYDVHTTFLFDLLIPLWTSDSSPYPCGKRLATVYPDGTIGPCIRNHSFKTGTLFDPNPLEKLQCRQFYFHIENPELPDECRACESKTTCQGGCPNEKLLLTGTAAGKSVLCDLQKEIIPRLRYLDAFKADRHSSRSIL